GIAELLEELAARGIRDGEVGEAAVAMYVALVTKNCSAWTEWWRGIPGNLRCKNGKGAYAKFQFTSNEKAKHIISMAKQKCLNYGPHRKPLQAYANDMVIVKQTDIVKQTFDHCMEQIEHNKRTLFYLGQEYKLELSCKNIWQIEQRRKYGRPATFFLIQIKFTAVSSFSPNLLFEKERTKEGGSSKSESVTPAKFFTNFHAQLAIWFAIHTKYRFSLMSCLSLYLTGAPRIYECHINTQSYFKEIPDDQWVRATDFSPSHSIGQSSASYLEIPHGVNIPKFLEISAESKESVSKFNLEAGFTYTRNLDLVSIHGCFPGLELDEELFKLVAPEGIDVVLVERALERLFHSTDYCHENRQGGSVSNTKRTAHLSNYTRDLLLPWMLDVYLFAGS
ncbi:LOW QUALITY PROTEIN: hypothetical protein RJ640_019483, partial [Escallonia rubra]